MQMRFQKINFLWKYWDIPVLLFGWFQIQGQRKGVELCHTMTLRLTKLEFLKYIFMFGFQEWVYDLFLIFFYKSLLCNRFSSLRQEHTSTFRALWSKYQISQYISLTPLPGTTREVIAGRTVLVWNSWWFSFGKFTNPRVNGEALFGINLLEFHLFLTLIQSFFPKIKNVWYKSDIFFSTLNFPKNFKGLGTGIVVSLIHVMYNDCHS